MSARALGGAPSVIGAISITLAAYELFAYVTGCCTISRARGIYRVGVFTWWLALGAHLSYEALADHIAERATL
jgi:hypothetical protein